MEAIEIAVRAQTCSDCKKETVVVRTDREKNYLIVISECKDCQVRYTNRFSLGA